MRLIDAYWAMPVNRLHVACDCGMLLDHPSNVSLCTCPGCGRAELWHSVDPRPESGPWSEPVMQRVSFNPVDVSQIPETAALTNRD